MNSHALNIIYRDLFLGIIAIMVFLVYVYLIQVNPESKKEAEGQTPPGSVTVFITWPEGDTDIDLWVTGPGEMRPVGYSSANGVLFNLLRDDLGTMPDLTKINMESAYSRGSPAGEYIVNLHCYRCPVLPQKVNVEVGLSKAATGGKGTVVLATATVDLMSNGQERTAMRFELDAAGALVPGSLNYVFTPLRAAQPSGGFP